jgi:hypothetical protein
MISHENQISYINRYHQNTVWVFDFHGLGVNARSCAFLQSKSLCILKFQFPENQLTWDIPAVMSLIGKRDKQADEN